jgi:hypothetical protein
MHGRVEGHLSPCLSTRTDARTKVIIERRHWRLSVNDTTVTVGGMKMPAWHGAGCGMKNEIVVGLDDSPSGKAVVDWAAEQAKTLGAVLRAVHVAAMTA